MDEGYKIGALIFALSLFVFLFGGLGLAYLFAYRKAKKEEKKKNNGGK